MPHHCSVRVRFGELDPYAHVNHTVYVQYFEHGRVEALASVGQPLDVLLAEDAAMVVAQISTRFLQPAHLGDDLVVESAMTDVRRASATWLQRIVRDDSVIATQVARVGCTTRAGRPRAFPAAMAGALDPFVVDGDFLGSEAPRR